MTEVSFFNDLEISIQKKHLLHHDFYRAWSEGRLSLECLKEYAKEYYHHVKAFPMYLSAVHSHTKDAETRKALLQNLIDEEAGSPNHPELWRQFAFKLGVQAEELDHHEPCQEIKNLIETFHTICLKQSVSEGLAALYAYESQIPAISQSKIDGLKKYYHMPDVSFWRYFAVHIEADEEHSRIERELLHKHVNAENAPLALLAANKTLDALWNFLSHLVHRYQIRCSC